MRTRALQILLGQVGRRPPDDHVTTVRKVATEHFDSHLEIEAVPVKPLSWALAIRPSSARAISDIDRYLAFACAVSQTLGTGVYFVRAMEGSTLDFWHTDPELVAISLNFLRSLPIAVQNDPSAPPQVLIWWSWLSQLLQRAIPTAFAPPSLEELLEHQPCRLVELVPLLLSTRGPWVYRILHDLPGEGTPVAAAHPRLSQTCRLVH